jgi:uncharacterized protein
MKKPLYNFSKDPMTGFYRDGYCRVGPDDTGNHSVAGISLFPISFLTGIGLTYSIATLTDSFLDFSASRGNNLRSIGLTAGCKWCLCAGRWKEALDAAAKNKDLPKDVVPKVYLHATHEKALDVLTMEELKLHSAAPEAAAASGRQDASESRHSHKNRIGGPATKERTALANKGEMNGPRAVIASV